MTSESATAAAAPASQTAETTENAANGEYTKIDPITAVQDSIDGLALSLFEALRGVRDAVAPESLEVPGASRPITDLSSSNIMTAFQDKEATEEVEKDATPKERLLNGVNVEYFPPRAFDLLEPDYESFLLAYLTDNPYAKELVERFAALDEKSKAEDATTNSNQSAAKDKVKFPLTQAEYTKLLIDSEHQRDIQTTNTLAQDILTKSAAVNDLVAKLPGMERTRQIQMERINELIKFNHDVTRELEDAYGVARKRREEVRVALGESTCLALGVEEDT